MHSILKINADLFARLFQAYRTLPPQQAVEVRAACEALADNQTGADDRDDAQEQLVELLMSHDS